MGARWHRRRRDGGEFFGRLYLTELAAAAAATRGGNGAAVLAALRCFAGPREELEGRVAPTVAQLAKLLSVDARTIQRTLRALEAHGIVAVERNLGARSTYRFCRSLGDPRQDAGGAEDTTAKPGYPCQARGDSPATLPEASGNAPGHPRRLAAPVGFREQIDREKRKRTGTRRTDDQRAAESALESAKGAFAMKKALPAPLSPEEQQQRRQFLREQAAALEGEAQARKAP
jgi:DNA-binding transcriptional ArsR family regulator